MRIYNKNMKKILIVEDQKLIIKSLELNLGKNYEVSSLSSFAQAASFDVSKYDLALIDISLGDGSGLDLYEIFKEYKDIPIIFLTANDEETTIVKALDMGADDYITKPFTLGELNARIRKVLPDSLSFKNISINAKEHVVLQDGMPVDLSIREYQLLEIFIKNKNKVLERTRLLELWETDDEFVNDNTLSVTISRLRNKLDLKELKTIKHVGYVLNEE
ncbi:DNA-binding response regulator [Fastidiosipila sanguinis]|uniref:Stage 0 sporulation protein A homolog n=2 Tax=Fastidiosipila sanguinis TaxID=236753 RepID=A0A2S0KLZ4_9FIRM|nr:DNA-binding response regulator [Fastidiosipila sanguinis]